MSQRARRVTPALLSACLALTVTALPTVAKGWGDDGHRVVGELAWRHLSAQARLAVQESLTDPGYESLAEAATWPDTFARKDTAYDAMKPFHYVNIAPAAVRYRRERDCAYGCVVTALSQFVTLLASTEPPARREERRRCVYWIAHFMGDIHQPLHVSHPDGRGGISTSLRFFDAPEPRNAHWIWDVGLLEKRPSAMADGRAAYLAITDELESSLDAQRIARFQLVTDPEAIANEVLTVAQTHAFLRAADHVDAKYAAGKWPIVAQQLQKAGLRLAAVLNRALAPQSPRATR